MARQAPLDSSSSAIRDEDRGGDAKGCDVESARHLSTQFHPIKLARVGWVSEALPITTRIRLAHSNRNSQNHAMTDYRRNRIPGGTGGGNDGGR